MDDRRDSERLTAAQAGPATNGIDAAVARWQSQLLQLNRRNNLLYFKGNPAPAPGSRRTLRCVPITGFSPDEIDEYLQGARKGRTFDYAARRRRKKSFEAQPPAGESVSADDDIKLLRGDLPTDVEPLALQRVLLRFLRKEREWLEEQGLNVLFLAVGFLEWIDEEHEPTKSPLLLLPCDLKRSSPRDPFVLSREDDDVTANATLRHKLQELDLVLPEFNHETYADYLEEVTNLVDGRSGWRVNQDVVLSTFQYTKLAMWEDLERMRTNGVTRPLVRQLAGEQLDIESTDAGQADHFPPDSELAGGHLDDILDLRQEVTVLPADHSQLRAVAAARRGGNLVIHGPPGTGKSQTIVNIISNLLAHGKRVLFVSEKSVALDVVKDRLDQEDLGVFCLDMHSDRASKTSVYAQLRHSIEDSDQVTDFDYSYELLEASRTELNDVVRALHETRRPLGRSVYQIHGEYAQLRDLPDVEFHATAPAAIDSVFLKNIVSLAERIARRPEEFRNLETSKWKLLKASSSSVRLADRLRQDMGTVRRVVNRAESLLHETADLLGASVPANMEQASTLDALARHLDQKPVVLRHWLNKETLAKLRRVASEQREQQRQALMLAERTGKAFGGQAPAADYHKLSRSIRLTPAETGALRQALGSDWSVRLMPDPSRPLKSMKRVQSDAADLVATLDDFAAALGIEPQSASWTESLRTVDLAYELLEVNAVPEAWTDPNHLAEVRRLLGTAHTAHMKLDSAETEFFSSFDPELVDAVDREMLVRFRIDHQSGLRRLLLRRSAYQSDLRILRGHTKIPRRMDVAGWLSVVEHAIEIQSLRRNWEEAYADIKPHISDHARSRDTDWTQIQVLIKRLEHLLRSWPWEQDQLRRLLTNSEDLDALEGLQQVARTRFQSLEDSIRNLDSDRLDGKEIGPAGILATVQQALAPIERLEKATRGVIAGLAIAPDDWPAFGSLIDDLARLQSVEQDERASRDDLRHDFGEWFKGRDTDWNEVIGAVTWCWILLDMAGQRLSERLRELVCMGTLPFYPNSVVATIESLQSAYPRDLGVLHRRFDVAGSPWDSWESAPFAELMDWIESVHKDADSATNWIEFKLAADEFDRILGSEAVRQIRNVTEDAALVPGIANRRLFATWLDAVSQQDPRLRDFTARDHEARRLEFRNLDQQLPQVLRGQARTTLFEKYPNSRTSMTRSGQLGVLRGELTKRRRQKSVRQLLAAAPQLIQALKPCFLMSPLAVSQYLEQTGAASANLDFDTVIFDEASQVLPEDAVPAISRAKQTIVVGDRRQLPPTTLFQHRYEHEDDDDDGDDEVDWFEGRESILDVMVGMAGSGVAENYLAVHYRSHHDSLIRYSNHHFYNNRLLTFPSPRKPAAHGVQAVYLPDGRYEAGGSRTNRIEAEKVVELVFELMRTRPNAESFGVVALSRAQADLIETLIDEARIYEPEFDGHFAPERGERFFVKNLENVQGDERDHIILSIGYGPTDSGQVYNRFGPINSEGGERRLNVAVSRARRSMTVVHSLQPEDITSESQGARLLKRYLEFARSPDTALEQNLSVNGQAETESPFEEAVRRALVERGHRVDVQVGVAGYRIDLAIKAEDGQGYALGIECDGATYHSAPAARDRDWLRQSVLEGLGWKIHRVWSRAWIQNPERELEAIDLALNASETSIAEVDPPLGLPREGDIAQVAAPHEVAMVSDEDWEDQTSEVHRGSDGIEDAAPNRATVVSDEIWRSRSPSVSQQSSELSEADGGSEGAFGNYEVADLSQIWVGETLRGEDSRILEELISVVVQDEGPVHVDVVVERIRIRYGVGRVQRSTRALVYQAVTGVRGLRWLPKEMGGSAVPDSFLTTLGRGEDLRAVNPFDVHISSPFLTLPEQSTDLHPRAPRASTPRNHASRRRIEHIPLLELKAGVLVCANLLYGAGRSDLIKETARQFGFRRTGKDIVRRIGKAVDQLVQAGKLAGDAEMLTVAD